MDCPKHNRPMLPLAYCGGNFYNNICQGCIDEYEVRAMSLRGKTFEYHGPEVMGPDGVWRREQRLA